MKKTMPVLHACLSKPTHLLERYEYVFFSSRHRLELKKNSKNEGINIREGVMENMVAVIDPALLDANHREQKSIYQVILKPVHTLFVKTNSALKEACTRPEVFVRSNFF